MRKLMRAVNFCNEKPLKALISRSGEMSCKSAYWLFYH